MNSLIVGGGLAGLSLANMLNDKSMDFTIVEGRARFGGRIKTETYAAGYFDLGPAWFWPGQPRIAALIERLGLSIFDQFADGILIYEDENGRIERNRGFSSMQGSWRLEGGLGKLTDTLAARLPAPQKMLNTRVIELIKTGAGITATFDNGDTLVADNVVLALPPRLAAKIRFSPALPDTTIQSMAAIPTWMAGQAKAVAVYEKPFWREQDLSGDVMSRFGPMVEIHDASVARGGPYALFGFIGIPPEGRANTKLLHENLRAQLIRVFGVAASHPLALFVKDWASDPLTAVGDDKAPLLAHPAYGLPPAMANLWDDKLHFGSSEVADEFGGYVEGALEAAETVFEALSQRL